MSGPAPFSFDELLDLLRGRQVADAPCPLCSPLRKAINRIKPVLRLWRIEERLISYHCVHCEASGYAWEGGEPGRIDPVKLAEARRQSEALNAEDGCQAGVKRPGPSMPAASPSWHSGRGLFPQTSEDLLQIAGDDGVPARRRALPARHRDAVRICPGDRAGVLAIRPEDVMAVHLTRLDTDGSKLSEKPKIMIGQGAKGFPIVVAPPNDLLGLVITEGIEDALSVHQATGLGAWAAGAKDRLVGAGRRHPRLDGFRERTPRRR